MSWNTFLEEMDLEAVPFSDDALSYLDTRSIDVEEPHVGSVDLSRVVGTTHPDYCGKTWGQLKPVPGTSEGDFINNWDVAFQGLKRAVGNVHSSWIHRITAALWSNQVEVGGPLPVPSFALPTKVKQRWDTDN
ncbi:MAG: hypothetical protein ACTHWH_03745 [Marinobacter sp.]